MNERDFQPADVDRLIPRLAHAIERARTARVEVGTLTVRLDAERQRIGLAGGGIIDRVAWKADSQRLERATAGVREALDAIAAMGGVVKDLDLGLVDFPHQRHGRRVNLCWKYGETRVTHWHGLDEGYANRRPL